MVKVLKLVTENRALRVAYKHSGYPEKERDMKIGEQLQPRKQNWNIVDLDLSLGDRSVPPYGRSDTQRSGVPPRNPYH